MGYRGTALADGGEDEDKVQRRAVGQVELECTEDFALHSEELLLGVGVVHQVAQSRHLTHTDTHRGNIWEKKVQCPTIQSLKVEEMKKNNEKKAGSSQPVTTTQQKEADRFIQRPRREWVC